MALTTLLLRRLLGPLGDEVALDYRLRLVNAAGNLVSALDLETGAPLHARASGSLALDDEAPVALTLIPQTRIATADGAATFWELRLRGEGESDVYRWVFSVPASAEPLELADLIAAQVATPDQAAALIARVAALESNQLPAAEEGDILVYSDGAWHATDTLPGPA